MEPVSIRVELRRKNFSLQKETGMMIPPAL